MPRHLRGAVHPRDRRRAARPRRARRVRASRIARGQVAGHPDPRRWNGPGLPPARVAAGRSGSPSSRSSTKPRRRGRRSNGRCSLPRRTPTTGAGSPTTTRRRTGAPTSSRTRRGAMPPGAPTTRAASTSAALIYLSCAFRDDPGALENLLHVVRPLAQRKEELGAMAWRAVNAAELVLARLTRRYGECFETAERMLADLPRDDPARPWFESWHCVADDRGRTRGRARPRGRRDRARHAPRPDRPTTDASPAS